MAVSLKKGENVSLSKTDPNLKNVLLGLGWDARASDGADFDLDASLFMVGENGKVQNDDWFIFSEPVELTLPLGRAHRR